MHSPVSLVSQDSHSLLDITLTSYQRDPPFRKLRGEGWLSGLPAVARLGFVNLIDELLMVKPMCMYRS